MSRTRYLSLGLLLALSVPVAAGAPASSVRPAAWCEEQWAATAPAFLQANDFEGLRDRWLALAGECRGSVAWESRLALVHASLGAFDQARATLEAVDGVTSAYGWLAELVFLLNDAREHAARGSVDADYLDRLGASWDAYVQAHPLRPEGYRELGNVRMLQGRYADAAVNLEKATDTSDQPWLVFRDLTIAYARLDRADEALRAAATAMAQRRGLSRDPEFVYAIARANAGAGRFTEARKALDLVEQLQPGSREQPDYRETLRYLEAREKASRAKP